MTYKELKDLRKKLQKTEKINEELEKRLNDKAENLGADLVAQKKELDETVKAHEAEVDSLKQNNETLNDSLQKLEDTYAKLTNEIESLNDKVIAEANLRTDRENELKEQKERLHSLEAELTELKKQHGNLDAEKLNIEKSLNYDILELNNQIESLNKTIKTLEAEKSTLDAELIDWQKTAKETAQSSISKVEFDQEIEKYKNEIEETRTKIQNIEKENLTLKNQIEASDKDYEQKLGELVSKDQFDELLQKHQVGEFI